MSNSDSVKSFHFIQGKPSVQPEYQQENQSTENHVSIIESKDQPNTIEIHQSLPKLTPSTPATRLPLVDLLGENDENKYLKAPTNTSPEEHIGWLPSKSPTPSQSKTTPAPCGRKRARSSSPASASQKSAIKRAKLKAALDLEELKRSLQTPQTDPATSLWNRYNVGTSADTPLGQRLATIVNGNGSSPPYATSEQVGNISGLRRWTSCGMEFPSSKRKRRRTQRTTDMNRNVEIVDETRVADVEEIKDQSKATRIGSLLEKISASLEKAKNMCVEDENAPSSSSPLPERQEDFDRQSISPLRAPDLANRSGGQLSKIAKEPSVEEANERQSQQAASKDFEDPCPTSQALQKLNVIDKNFEKDVTLSGNQPQVTSQDEANVEIFNEDDFEDDFNLSESDFEEIVATFETERSTLPGQSSNPLQKQGLAQPADEKGSDELDDDVDEELFAAAEASATQSLSTAGRSKSSVFIS